MYTNITLHTSTKYVMSNYTQKYLYEILCHIIHNPIEIPIILYVITNFMRTQTHDHIYYDLPT